MHAYDAKERKRHICTDEKEYDGKLLKLHEMLLSLNPHSQSHLFVCSDSLSLSLCHFSVAFLHSSNPYNHNDTVHFLITVMVFL